VVYPPNDGEDWADAHQRMGAAELGAWVRERLEAMPRHSVSRPVEAGGAQGEPWPDPIPLDVRPRPVPVLKEHMLPPVLRPWLADIAERIQCPLEFPAVAAVVGLGSVIGRKVAIRPRRYDDWVVVPNLWGALVAPPSAGKSPALGEALKPLHRLEALAAKEHEKAMGEYEADALALEARVKAIKAQMQTAAKNEDGERMEALKAEYARLKRNEAEAPGPRRYIVNDATIEALGQRLNENPNGLLLVRDELVGFLKSLDREDRSNDRSFYLEAFSGLIQYVYDRVGRGTLRIESTTVSIIGGIQPARLRPYVWHAVNHGSGDDGLLQRFQLMVWPDPLARWRDVQRAPDRHAQRAVFDLFEAVAALEQPQPDEYGNLPAVRFDPEAQDRFDAWHYTIQNRVRDPELHPAMAAHLAKYPKLVPALAVIFEVAANGGARPEAIGLEALELALRWADFLEAHAERVYSGAADPASLNARLILSRRDRLPDPLRVRDVQMKKWAGLDTAERMREALDVLVEHGYLRAEERATGPRGGRPGMTYQWHPKADAFFENGGIQRNKTHKTPRIEVLWVLLRPTLAILKKTRLPPSRL
jgi:putative DNA primase/helicase